MTVAPVLELVDVVIEREGHVVLHSVDLAIPDTGITAIVGPSGSGKSSLLRLCNRLDVPARGEVRLHGTPIGEIDPRSLRRRVGMVFQRPAVFPGSVADNLTAALPTAEPAQLVAVLERVGLDPALLGRDADRLSGGEAQRMCLARTLLTDPEVLLADEPTSSLDEGSSRRLEALATALADAGVPTLWVTHDRVQARRIAQWLVTVDGGRVSGPVPMGAGGPADDDQGVDDVG